MNKVLDWVNKRIYHCKDFLENSEPVEGAESYYKEQLEIAEEIKRLVKKEKPMKVKDLSNGYRLEVQCPSCGETLIDEYECIDNQYHKRCHECGQRLDWSDK